MKQRWRVVFDRYPDEQKAKTGECVSLDITVERIAVLFSNAKHPPKVVEVVTGGLGELGMEALRKKGLPVEEAPVEIRRVSGADIYMMES